jgi:hypothetical protein
VDGKRHSQTYYENEKEQIDEIAGVLYTGVDRCGGRVASAVLRSFDFVRERRGFFKWNCDFDY